jgi:hypothetical protein
MCVDHADYDANPQILRVNSIRQDLPNRGVRWDLSEYVG